MTRTDRERFEELFFDMKIPFINCANILNISVHNKGETVVGYRDFMVEIEFDKDGTFKTFGIWE